MGRKLSDEERGRRLVGSVLVRELGSAGKCKLCKEKVAKGQKSLRYTEVVYGRKQECGLCLKCAASIWMHAEDSVGRVSAEIQKHLEGEAPPVSQPGVIRPPVPENPPEPPQMSLVVAPGLPESAQQDMAACAQNRQNLMKAMFGENS